MAIGEELAGLRCDEMLEALADYVDGELPAERRAKVEAHVAACPRCARFGGMYGAVVARLRAQLRGDARAPTDDAAAFERLRQRLG